ncbi:MULTISPECIES: hypothetical protein [unclassified Phaeobacter]|uniref:hypothetical protein n=1 Tax=unclassified Phaeobacter TaxID=2621772 RepID=UPI003A87EB14
MTDEAKTMTDEAKKGPTWGYKAGPDGEPFGEIFPDGKLPKGWVDSPAKLKGAKA